MKIKMTDNPLEDSRNIALAIAEEYQYLMTDADGLARMTLAVCVFVDGLSKTTRDRREFIDAFCSSLNRRLEKGD